jgi:SynChlorMet cassette radical SAM/SPASM protein ScmE
MFDPNCMSSPRQVDIAISGKCNLSCAYCFYEDEMAKRANLTTDKWLAFFDELGKLGVMKVCLTGGEVFTRPDLFSLIDGVIANRMRYQLLTNGTLITAKTLAQFEQGKRRLRLDSIQISIDGSCATVHNLSRPNSFENALHGLRLLHEASFPLTVRVTVNRYNVNDLKKITHLLLDEIGLRSFTINEAFACGATNRFDTGIMLSPQQRQQAMLILTELAERYNGRITASAGPLALAHEQAAINQAIAAGKTKIPGRGYLTACGGVFSKMAVLHDGAIVPCHNLSDLVLGNIQVDEIGAIWRSHPVMTALRSRYVIPLETLDTCRECTYQGFCTGGCPGGAHFLNGDANTRNPADCYRILIGEETYPSVGIPQPDRTFPLQIDHNES